MFCEDTDLAAEIAQKVMSIAGDKMNVDGVDVLIKEASYKLAQQLEAIINEQPTGVVVLALGSIIGAVSIRLTTDSADALEERTSELVAQGIDPDEMITPHPDIHAMALMLLGRRYIRTVARVAQAEYEVKEHRDNGGQFS